MDDLNSKINKILEFIENYIKWSKKRGRMYGGIGELESNWNLLDQIYLIINDFNNNQEEYSFPAFLMEKGFGVKCAATIIKEMNPADPYAELNRYRKEYEKWRKRKLHAMKKPRKAGL